MQNISQFLK